MESFIKENTVASIVTYIQYYILKHSLGIYKAKNKIELHSPQVKAYRMYIYIYIYIYT